MSHKTGRERLAEGERRAHRVLKVWDIPQGDYARLFNKMRFTRKLCSCPWCGNPRKWFDAPYKGERMEFE